VILYFSPSAGSKPVNGCFQIDLLLANPRSLGLADADASGQVEITTFVPQIMRGRDVQFQALERSTCRVNAPIAHVFD
jgi:hypothetical protein